MGAAEWVARVMGPIARAELSRRKMVHRQALIERSVQGPRPGIVMTVFRRRRAGRQRRKTPPLRATKMDSLLSGSQKRDGLPRGIRTDDPGLEEAVGEVAKVEVVMATVGVGREGGRGITLHCVLRSRTSTSREEEVILRL